MGSNHDFDLIIEPGRSNLQYWRDLWHFRELFAFLAWRDLLVRYKQTVIGVAWSVIRPVLSMVVFTVIFGKLAKLPSGSIPYPVMVFAAMLPWQYFANALTESGNSLVANAAMISKIYFPRLIVPSSSVIVSLVDFLISFVILFVLMFVYHYSPDWRIVALPLFLLMATLIALGVGYWFSALMVKYRDFRHIVPFVVQFGLYISPVGFNSSIIPAKWRLLYSLNPMVGIIDGFRWSLLRGDVNYYLPALWLSIVLTAVIFCSGIWYFRKTERNFADII